MSGKEKERKRGKKWKENPTTSVRVHTRRKKEKDCYFQAGREGAGEKYF